MSVGAMLHNRWRNKSPQSTGGLAFECVSFYENKIQHVLLKSTAYAVYMVNHKLFSNASLSHDG